MHRKWCTVQRSLSDERLLYQCHRIISQNTITVPGVPISAVALWTHQSSSYHHQLLVWLAGHQAGHHHSWQKVLHNQKQYPADKTWQKHKIRLQSGIVEKWRLSNMTLSRVHTGFSNGESSCHAMPQIHHTMPTRRTAEHNEWYICREEQNIYRSQKCLFYLK